MDAPTSRYGTPDDFRYLVDQCHQHNIGVILDWVPAHFAQDKHGLFRFDGITIYEYEDPQRGWHPDWKSCIYNSTPSSCRNPRRIEGVAKGRPKAFFWNHEGHEEH